MGKVLYSASMSLDGFIAGAGGDASWMTEYLGPDPLVADVVTDVGALLVGNRTFRGDDPHKGTPEELFERPGGDNVKLERLRVAEGPRLTWMWLRVVR